MELGGIYDSPFTGTILSFGRPIPLSLLKKILFFIGVNAFSWEFPNARRSD